MNNAELYQQSNVLQKRDASQVLEEFAKKIKWKKSGAKVIDLGCGDGSVTVEILRNFVPNDIKKLVGCDISEKMIYYANKHHRDEKTVFFVMDIASELPEQLKRSFDHVFSFYVLHWIPNQMLTFTNIYNLLSENGSCLLIFLGHMPVFDIYRLLSRSNKWSSWLKDVDRFISPYHDSEVPEYEITKIMTNVGFKNVEVKCQKKSFYYNSIESLKKAVRAINPFNLPSDVFDNFMEDYLKVVKDMRLITEVNNNIDGPIRIRVDYSLLIAYGTK